MIRALIVEDEPLAIDRLRSCLAFHENVNVVGQAMDGPTAVTLIDTLAPELVFLDIRLPQFGAFDVLRRIQHKPGIIFTTSHSEYAVTAFEWGAFDYLIKPFDRERLARSLERFNLRTRTTEEYANLEERISTASTAQPISRFFVKSRGQVLPIDVSQVTMIQAEDDYSAVHIGGNVHLVHLPLREFCRRLDPQKFRRVHRSFVVNIEHIQRIEPSGRGVLLHMNSGAVIPASRSGSQELRDLRL